MKNTNPNPVCLLPPQAALEDSAEDAIAVAEGRASHAATLAREAENRSVSVCVSHVRDPLSSSIHEDLGGKKVAYMEVTGEDEREAGESPLAENPPLRLHVTLPPFLPRV